MVCKNCGFQISGDSTFCPQCGTRMKPVEKKRVVDYITEEIRNDTCIRCGATVSASMSFCGKCGSSRVQGTKTKRIPKCVCCDEPLLLSARFCIMCNLGYIPSEDGYVEIPSLPKCANCATMVEENMAFCTKCGTKIQHSEQTDVELCLPVCPNCQSPYERGTQKCANCGLVHRNLMKYPIVRGNLLACPVCGEEGMPANRKVCWKCGAEWTSEPWFCHYCGKQNLYKTQKCFNCHAKRQ